MKGNRYSFQKGSYLYVEGDEDADNVFIIENGEIELLYASESARNLTKTCRAGDIIGFVSSLCGRPRTESARALTDTTVVTLPRDGFLVRLQNNSELAFKIINYFAEYLRSYDDMIFPGSFTEDALPLPHRLLTTGSFYYDSANYETAYYILSRLLQSYPEDAGTEKAREIIRKIEAVGFRSITEPIKQGIYHSFTDGQVIFCEDEPGESLYIIKEGRVKIVKYNNGTEIMLSVLNEGDIFGELAIVSKKPRNATAISFGRSILLPVNRSSLVKLINKSPLILKRIFTAISQRVWFTHIRLEVRSYRHSLTRIYAFLKNKLLEDNISLKSGEKHVLNFGIDELFKMVELTHKINEKTIEEVLNDANLRFNFGQITILSARELAAKAHYYRSRDKINQPDTLKLATEADNNTGNGPLAGSGKREILTEGSEQNSVFSELNHLEDD